MISRRAYYVSHAPCMSIEPTFLNLLHSIWHQGLVQAARRQGHRTRTHLPLAQIGAQRGSPNARWACQGTSFWFLGRYLLHLMVHPPTRWSVGCPPTCKSRQSGLRNGHPSTWRGNQTRGKVTHREKAVAFTCFGAHTMSLARQVFAIRSWYA